ncbi:hypothetical protein B005_0011 [Nocardiopsis alba ATCC BAA-2165]|uniref:Uncharacterized protein n=1 Tax=Nocardiopsis alba (strain ATCC BAA-2165 / BE74) TaxID=1205910 RepID=J7L673_NOCAA|nr:hypothetical protein B005_0011 [Nocardiopsis alba ATCC BAA-2165]
MVSEHGPSSPCGVPRLPGEVPRRLSVLPRLSKKHCRTLSNNHE